MTMTDARNVGGRPEIGPAFSTRFPADLLCKVDDAAAVRNESRAEWLRVAAQDRVHITREELSTFVLWLLDDQMVGHSEVARVIEKPWCYRDWLDLYRTGGDIEP